MFKKVFFIIFVYCVSNLISKAEVLRAGISYTEDKAREIAFINIEKKIDINLYKAYFIDKNNKQNIEAIKNNKKKFINRKLYSFSNGVYAIEYKKNRGIAFFYKPDGVLYSLSIDKKCDNYPCKTLKYDRDGSLISVSLDVSSNEQFIFDINGKLRSYWLNQNCYNKEGLLIYTRE